MLRRIAHQDLPALDQFDSFLDRKYPAESHFVSAKPSQKKLTFTPHIFDVPDITVEGNLVAVMMPFRAEFRSAHNAIKAACEATHFRCLRADDIWEDLRARIVVVNFTGRNPNVMYETGIAHTLGKLVISISQSLDDVPFDMGSSSST